MMKPQLTIEAFADWCEKQPAEKQYDYCLADSCAMTQFVRAIGFDVDRVLVPVGTDKALIVVNGKLRELPTGFEDASWQSPQTFGALAARLRAVSP